MTEKRFYKYSLLDSFFIPLASKLSTFFIRFNISANKITLLSGFLGIFGAILFSTSDKLAILLGSFGYILYYLFDYIDGIVARSKNKSSISGMFIDIFMGPIVAISMAGAIIFGSKQTFINYGFNPVLANTIGIIYLISIIILNTRFAFVWLTVGSKIVEDRYKKYSFTQEDNFKKKKRLQKIFIRSTLNLFHENILIFSFPLIGIVNFLWDIDLRFIYPILGMFFLFPACFYDVYTFIKYDKVYEVYRDISSNAEILNPINTIYLK